MFSTDSKVLDPRPKHMSSYPPFVLRGVSIKHGVHNLNRLIREFVGFYYTLRH